MRFLRTSGIVRFAILLVALLLWQGTATAGKRETKTLVLGNGLAVMLIHDTGIDRSASALAVGAGSLYDPPDALGMAHYLEHMLFLGTEKYPEVDSYKKYLTENSGSSNAYTADEITNYFFQVSHGAFEGALDRFSQFFKAPSFDKKYAEREINAVSSEHDKNRLQDGWRTRFVREQVAKPGHPLRNFHTGNKETLAATTREKLLEFYNNYYSAGNMKLTLLSNRPIKEMEALAGKYFSDIRNFPVTHPPIDPDYRHPLQGKYRLLKVKTIKDTRTLHLEFPTIRLIDHHASKPDKLIAWLLGYEGKGSLLSQLKAEGLALGLSAGGGFVHPNVNSLNVSVSLTQVGVERYERVLELIFSYVDLLKKRGIDEATFKERQTMAQIDFDWKNPDEGMWFVAGKASALHHYPLAEVETLPHLFVKYDPAIYRSVLDTLTPENALVSLETNSVAVDQTEKYYGTEYSLTEVDGESFARLKNPTAPSAIAYPVANPFIPYGLQLVEEKPHLVKDDPMGKVWFLFDHRFNQPKVYLSLRLETPLTYDTVEHYVLAKLYNAAVLEALNEEMYPIEMAGLSYSLSVNKEGVVIGLGGYSQSITHLVRLVSQNLVRPKIDERQFNDLKEAGLRAMRNGKLGQAVARGAYYSNLFWFKKTYDEDAQIRAMTPVTLKDVLEYAGHLYERVHVAGMGHGNWSEEGVRASVDTLLKEIKSGPLPEAERYKEEVEVLVRGEKIRFSQKAQDNNNAMAYILQAGERDFERQAKLALIGYIVESDFFTQMRTNQQLGYLVSSFQRRREDRLFFNFVIQSATYSSFELANRVEAWLAASAKLFDTLSDEDFEKFRAALITSIEKRGDSIAEVLGDWYYLAVEEKADFDFKKKYLAAAKRVAKSDVKALAHELFLDPVTPRLQILIRSKANEEAVPPGVFSDVPAIKNRRSAATDKAVVGK